MASTATESSPPQSAEDLVTKSTVKETPLSNASKAIEGSVDRPSDERQAEVKCHKSRGTHRILPPEILET